MFCDPSVCPPVHSTRSLVPSQCVRHTVAPPPPSSVSSGSFSTGNSFHGASYCVRQPEARVVSKISVSIRCEGVPLVISLFELLSRENPITNEFSLIIDVYRTTLRLCSKMHLTLALLSEFRFLSCDEGCVKISTGFADWRLLVCITS